jgi:peptide deformylase
MFCMSVNPQSISLVLYPDPILRQRGEEIDPSDATVQAVAKRMVEIMFEQNGVGLAAPQVGLAWRLFVTRDHENEEEGIAWVNPVLEVIQEEAVADEEGCLSLPDIRGVIRRPSGIRITGFDMHGNPMTAESDAFISRIWQHENDHLDGILIIDKMSTMDKLVNRRLIRDLERVQ